MDRLDHEDLDAFRDAARETLDALHAMYVADFDADDSGADVAHAIGESESRGAL